ncbi:MAG: CopG family transcriptional regulator [Xanthomonadaceae bacterium]|nr:CopG family transcriptional regulator [Xanthomonadaceae bacterium]MDE2248427.1 CopG family transcriptional regulator [Xanthomonadaceae bacterium]
MPTENRTARLTILIDPRKKAVFERLCAGEDTTPSQVVRQLIRDYIEQKSGHSWQSEYNLTAEKSAAAARKPRAR